MRCSQVISFEMTHKKSIENDLNRKWISEGMAQEQMSAYTLHVAHIIILCWHYQHGRIQDIIDGIFKKDINFLKSKQKIKEDVLNVQMLLVVVG